MSPLNYFLLVSCPSSHQITGTPLEKTLCDYTVGPRWACFTQYFKHISDKSRETIKETVNLAMQCRPGELDTPVLLIPERHTLYKNNSTPAPLQATLLPLRVCLSVASFNTSPATPPADNLFQISALAASSLPGHPTYLSVWRHQGVELPVRPERRGLTSAGLSRVSDDITWRRLHDAPN